MHESLQHPVTDRIGPTAADRAGRAAAATYLALADAATAPADTVAVSVLTAYVSPHTADDEAAAVVRAVLAELAGCSR